MKFILISIATVILFFSFFADCEAVENENKNKEEFDSFDQLFQPIKEREEIAKKIMDERAKLIASLIADAKIEEPPLPKEKSSLKNFHSKKHIAIIVLGGLRAVEAVPVLIENLGYYANKTYFGGWTARNAEEYCPSAVALIRIGSPAIPAVLDKLYFAEDEGTRTICTWILVEMLGKGFAKAQIDLSIAAFDHFINNARKPGDFTDEVVEKLSKLSKEQLIKMKTQLESLEKYVYFDITYKPRILNMRNIYEEIVTPPTKSRRGKFVDGKFIEEK